MLSEFELQRERNIQVNRDLLAQLGLEKPAPIIKPSRGGPAPGGKRKGGPIDDSLRRKSARVKDIAERKNYEEEDFEDEDSDDSDEFLSNADSESDGEATKTRKSKKRGRVARVRRGRRGSLDSIEGGGITEGDVAGLKRRTINGRSVQHLDRKYKRPDGKVFGPIRGVPVGKWWPTRLACSVNGVHPPPVSGIFGASSTGAYSVAVSGGYEDDIDEGFRFTYTGSGGRDLKGTKINPKNLRTAPQSCDQTLTGGNLALKTSCDTGEPVRVIRGYKAELGPVEGYRYDGIYTVMKAWEDMGLAGFKVWRFAFKRVDGQPPINYKAGPSKDHGELEAGSESESEAKAEASDSGDAGSTEDLAAAHSARKKQGKKQTKATAKRATTSPKKASPSKASSLESPASEKAPVEEAARPALRSSRRRRG